MEENTKLSNEQLVGFAGVFKTWVSVFFDYCLEFRENRRWKH